MATSTLDVPVVDGNVGGVSEYRIDELAQAAGTTVRNVRAYQDRGLLPPPRREGRAAVYAESHLARLRLIAELLGRGYTLGNIAELLQAWEGGKDLRDLLGLEVAVAGPWSDEAPAHVSAGDLAGLFGEQASADATRRSLELGYLDVEGDGFRARSPRQLAAAAELVAAGIPLDAVLDLAAELHDEVDRIAAGFVELVTDHVLAPAGQEIDHADLPRLAELIQRLRPLAATVVDAELARAMERHAQAQLGDRLASLRDHRGVRRGEAS